MSIQRLGRPSGLWRSLERGVRPSNTSRTTFALQQRRDLSVPTIRNEEYFKTNGVPGFLSPRYFNVAWTEYQSHLVEKINNLVAVDEDARQMSPQDLAIKYARSPQHAALFNYASTAFNNHFFVMGLSLRSKKVEDYPALHQDLLKTFGTIETLRLTMIKNALSMFGPGFTWLLHVRRNDSNTSEFRILNTYQAGSPFPEAGWRQQTTDMNTTRSTPQNSVGAAGSYSQSGRDAMGTPPGAPSKDSVVPILCVNTFEHAYIGQYGIWKYRGPKGDLPPRPSKEVYLEQWWLSVDWEEIENRYTAANARRPQQRQFAAPRY
ncbi:hypothetical protein MBLNU457_g2909t1 [Dothideomycetes sp. NU457]